MKINKQEILSSIEKLTRIQKILLQFLILAVICGASWYFYLDPAWEKIARLKEDARSLEEDITQFSIQAAKLPEMEEKLEDIQRELILANALLPKDAHALERLLASFEQLGNEKGVRFLLFQPGSEEVHQHYATRTVQLRLQGNFHHLMSYFDELSRLDRLVSLQSLRLSPLSGQQQNNVTLSAESVLLVYRSLSQAELEAREQ
ncbi:MAG: type 4a pilus biogenesis protein PilO [Desulfonatronovibrio sp.]